MTRTTITTSIDADLKKKAWEIIKYDLRMTIGSWIDKNMKDLILQHDKKKKEVQT